MTPYYETPLGKLYHGDCLEIMPELEPVDLVLTDPPYGVTSCSWDSTIQLDLMWKQLERIIKYNGPVVMFGNQPFTTTLISSNIKNFKYCWTWKKNYPTGISLSKYQPMRVIEDICVFYNGKITFNKQMKDCADSVKKQWKDNEKMELPSQIKGSKEHACSGAVHIVRHRVNPINFLDIKSVNRSTGTLHPTQKPVGLMEYLIKTYTNDNETILDFCIGSGTTAIACERLKRRWIGIEIEEKYCEIAAKRIEQERKQRKLF